MSKVCVLLAPGFEEIEAVTIINVLRRAEVEVTTLSVNGDGPGALEVTGSHGIAMRADAALLAAGDQAWDAVILPGGMPGSSNLRDAEDVQALLRRQHAAHRRVAAICAAPIALARAGVLAGRRATCYPGFEKDLAGATQVAQGVVTDGNVTTSRGPGTAFDFALELVVLLRGRDVAASLRAGMLLRD